MENHGQWSDGVRFKAAFPASAMFLQSDGVTWVRYQDDAPDLVHEYIQWSPERQSTFHLRGHAWRMRFDGANPASIALGEQRQAAYHNYFLGNDPSKWAGKVPVFEAVRYERIWPGIDMRWHGDEGNVKYDLFVDANADPSLVGFRYDGLDGLAIASNGDLVLSTSVGEVTEMRPVAWYADDRSPVVCAFALQGDRVSFTFPQGRDAARAMVIDPLLMGATYSGQTGASNYGHCATYDAFGNMYGGAQNFGAGFPTTLGAFQASPGGGFGTDIVVNKFTPDGVDLLMATYLGGDADDKPHSMIVNTSGELCVFGSSTGPGFPTSSGAYDPTHGGGSDIVIAHLSEDGTTLIGGTYIGGGQEDGRQMMTNNYGDTFRGEIMLDGADNIYIASSSSSSDFPVTPGVFQGALGGGQDAVVVGVDPTCANLLMSTFLGGSSDDNGLGLRFDGTGGIYVCGGTMSADFPMAGGGWQNAYQGAPKDGYIVQLTNAGATLAASTYFGTSTDDMAYFIDLDNDGDVYIYGQSDGDLAITPPGIYGQPGGGIFIAAFDPALTTPVFITTLGDGGFGFPLAPVAFLVDVCEHIYISGYNPSGTWETTPDALYEAGGSQFYLAAYDVDMTGILFGSFYGGSHVDGGTSRFDKNGIIYQGVCSGGNSMPTTANAYAPNNNVGWDLGVFKIDFQVAGVNAAGASTLNTGCAPVEIGFNNNSTGTQWLWDFGDGTPPVTDFEPSHVYTEPGAFTVMMIAMDSLACNLADTTYLPITIGEQQPIVAAFTSEQSIDCTLLQITTENNSTGNPLAFEWDMGDGTLYSDTNVTHDFSGPGDYTVQLIAYDPTGCSTADTASTIIAIGPPLQVEAAFNIEEMPGCDQLSVVATDQSTGVAPTYAWDMGDGAEYSSADVTHLFQGVGTYTITLIVSDPATCNLADTATVEVTVEPSVPVTAAFTAEQAFDCDDLVLSTENQSTGTNLLFDWQVSDGTQSTDTAFTHTISGPGTYEVILLVSDAFGCSPPQSDTLQVVIDPLEPVVADFTAAQVNSCEQLDVTTLNLSTGDSVSYAWDMGDGTVIDGENAQHSYTDPGTYTITLTITDLGCGQNDQSTLQVELINELPVALLNDSVVCPDDVAILQVQTADDVAYLWSTGETSASITVADGGIYTVTIDDGLCTGTATAEIIAAPRHDLSDSLYACPGSQLDLVVPIDGLSFAWNTGGTNRTERVIADNALYTYDMIDLWGCPHSDSIRVIALDSVPQVFAPNAFTPDGDGTNDVFRIAGFGERTVAMSVFNRWGQMLWTNEGKEPFWDGRYGGTIVQDGVYVYVLNYTGVCDNANREVYGHVTVVK